MSRDAELSRALDALVADDVGELLEQVRREATSVARRCLVDAYADALVRAVAHRDARRAPEPRPPSAAMSTPATGTYLYAVVDGSGASAATGEAGIQPGGAVESVRAGSLTAIVSDVDVVEMRRGCDEANVDEDGWLACAVRAHDRVVAAAFRSAPTVPVRFGVVYPDRAAVAQMLGEHAPEFHQELDRLAGRAEWNVKVFVDLPPDDESTDAEPARVPSDAATSPGLGFLSRERERRLRRMRRQEHVRAAVADVLAQLDAVALDRVDLPVGASGADGAPCLAATCLVARQDEQHWAAAVDGIRPDDDALRIEIDGPWPPFHFTALRLEPADG